MASIKFLLQSSSQQANIYLRLSAGRGKDIKRKTGYVISPKNWSKAKGMPKGNDPEIANLTNDLVNMRGKIESRLNRANQKGEEITGDWLEHEIDLINNKTRADDSHRLRNYIQYIIDTAESRPNQRGELGLSVRRVKGYKTFKGMIERYEREALTGRRLMVNRVDAKVVGQFKDWLLNQGYSVNYVGKNIDNLKAVCYDAEKNGIPISPTLKGVKSFSKQKSRDEIVYLSEEEQEIIASTDLRREALINARKWLLLGCLIGQRGGDLLSLTEANIKPLEGVRVIEMTQKKTGKLVAVPLLPQAEDIIADGMPYPLSIQKFNEYIKDVCMEAGIDAPTPGRKDRVNGIYPKHELMGSHVCRRSFATNYYGRIPTPILINITGHGTEKMFLKYIGKSAYDSALQMVEYFEKVKPNKEKPKTFKVLKSNAI